MVTAKQIDKLMNGLFVNGKFDPNAYGASDIANAVHDSEECKELASCLISNGFSGMPLAQATITIGMIIGSILGRNGQA
jgi:hypothetical protein